jgi:hypothetical protein
VDRRNLLAGAACAIPAAVLAACSTGQIAAVTSEATAALTDVSGVLAGGAAVTGWQAALGVALNVAGALVPELPPILAAAQLGVPPLIAAIQAGTATAVQVSQLAAQTVAVLSAAAPGFKASPLVAS